MIKSINPETPYLNALLVLVVLDTEDPSVDNCDNLSVVAPLAVVVVEPST